MKRITKEREERNMSQADLSYTLRISPALISKIERGKHYPCKPSQRKLSNFFNMSIDELLEEISEEEVD